MLIGQKLQVAQYLKESLELNVDYARDGIELFNRRFPYPQTQEASNLTELVKAIELNSQDISPLTGIPLLPETAEVEKEFTFIGSTAPTNGMHVMSIEKFADGWTLMAYTLPGETGKVRLLSTRDFKHFKSCGLITSSISSATPVFVKIYSTSEMEGYIRIVFDTGITHLNSITPIVFDGITNANGGDVELTTVLAVPHNTEYLVIENEDSDWAISSPTGVVYSRFVLEHPVAVLEAEFTGRSLFITGIWQTQYTDSGLEYRVAKIEYGGESTGLIHYLWIREDDLYGIHLHIVNGVPYAVACGTNTIYQLAFDDYRLVDVMLDGSKTIPLSPEGDSSDIVGAISFEGRILLQTMNGLVRYDVTRDEWNHCAISNLAVGYTSGSYAMTITASDDLFLTASAITETNSNYGFTTVKLPFQYLPVKRTFLPQYLATYGPNNFFVQGSCRSQDLRSWFCYKNDLFEHIVSAAYTTRGDNGIIVCSLDTNKLINIVIPGSGGPITIEEYATFSATLAESCIYTAQGVLCMTDGVSAYVIDPAGLTVTKSTTASYIPSAASIGYFNSCKTLGRVYVYIDQFSCAFVSHDMVTNASTVYYFTSNGVVQTLALTATLKVNGVDDLHVTCRRANEFWFSATIAGESKSVVFQSIANGTYASWDAFVASQVANDSWEVSVLKGQGYGVGGYLSDECLCGPEGVFSIGAGGELHRFNNIPTLLNVGGKVTNADQTRTMYCGYSYTEQQVYYSFVSNRYPYMTRGTIKVHSAMKDVLRNRFTITIPASRLLTQPAALFLETRDFAGTNHTRIRIINENGLMGLTQMKIGGADTEAVVTVNQGSTVKTFIPSSVTWNIPEDSNLINVVLTFDATNDLVNTNLLIGEFLDYYLIGTE